MSLLAFGGLGIAVLMGHRFSSGGRHDSLLLWINDLVAVHGSQTVGYGLIVFGVAFCLFWAAFGHNR